MFSAKIIGFLALFVCASAFPYNAYRAVPRKTIMFGSSYQGHPLIRRSYVPQSSMTMFATGGDAVATNSFVGDQYPFDQQEEQSLVSEQQLPQGYPSQAQDAIPLEPSEQNEVTQQSIPLDESAASGFDQQEEEILPSTTVRPARVPKRKQKPKTKVIVVDDEEEDDDEQTGWPFQLGRGAPSYNAFFPITFSGGSRSAGRQSLGDEEAIPGSATAIANAFSTGKGGVASSHATAFGDPALASYFLRRNLQKKNKPLTTEE